MPRAAKMLRGRLAPDAQTLQEMERSLALQTSASTPEAVCQALELCAPPSKRGKAKPKATPTPEAREAPQTPDAEVRAERRMERKVVRARPKARARRSMPLAPRAETTTLPPERAPSMVARNVALGVGGTGLLVSAVTLGVNVEERSNVGYAVGGVALGIGVIGLGTAGILTLMQDDDNPRVEATADGLRARF